MCGDLRVLKHLGLGLEQTPNYFLLVYFDMFSIRKDENCVKDGEELFVTAAEFS
jgi:hypothetical protein